MYRKPHKIKIILVTDSNEDDFVKRVVLTFPFILNEQLVFI